MKQIIGLIFILVIGAMVVEVYKFIIFIRPFAQAIGIAICELAVIYALMTVAMLTADMSGHTKALNRLSSISFSKTFFAINVLIIIVLLFIFFG